MAAHSIDGFFNESIDRLQFKLRASGFLIGIFNNEADAQTYALSQEGLELIKKCNSFGRREHLPDYIYHR
jgi:hypothetical protein